MNIKLSTYQKAQLEGLSQRDLIVMCYRGCIKYLQDAQQKLDAGDAEGFSDLIEKAHRVVFHLYTTLDMQQGGEIAQKLADLYSYIINQIYLLNATKNPELIVTIVRLLTTLKEGWEGIEGSGRDRSTGRISQAVANQQIVSVQI